MNLYFYTSTTVVLGSYKEQQGTYLVVLKAKLVETHINTFCVFQKNMGIHIL